MEAEMKRSKYRVRVKFYPIIWSLIVIVAVYLLVQFAILSFSDDVGQAVKKDSIMDVILSGICSNVMETGSSLVSYSMKEEEALAFPVNLVADGFALSHFAKDNSYKPANAQAASLSLYQNYRPNKKQEDVKEVMEQNRQAGVSEGISFRNITKGYLSKNYVLTNGALFQDPMDMSLTDQIQIGYLKGDVTILEDENGSTVSDSTIETITSNKPIDHNFDQLRDQLRDVNFLVKNFYTVDRTTKITNELFDADKLLGKDMTIKQKNDKPQILIYHTHSQEAYADSRPKRVEDTVVGVGNYLTKILEEDYGYNVIHDTTTYDLKGEKVVYADCYNLAIHNLKKILEDNPTIEVMIDLHRDSGKNRSIMLNGKDTAQIMLFNGLSRNQDGPIEKLDNPNLQNNLAFSLQMRLKSLELYPDLFVKNYLKSYRFNLHLRPKSLLVELGTVNNTVESAYNAMEPFANVLNDVLQGK
jgi:stage II sporulation protein P